MKHLQNLFGILLIMGIIMSCADSVTNSNDDDGGTGEDPQETTVEEDIENIESSLDNIITLMGDLENGNFSSTMKTFLGISGGEVTSDAWIEDVFIGLEDYIDVTATEDNRRFDFNAHTGIYEYNSSNGEWTKSSSSDIVLLFPSSESSNSNDMSVTISNYSDGVVSIDGENYYLPTSIHIDLEKGENREFGFMLNELVYSNDPDFPIPTTIDLEIFTAPFNHSLTFNQNTSTDFSLSFMVENGEEVVTGIDLNLTLTHDDYNNLQEGDLDQLTGSLLLTSDLTVDYEFNLGTLITIDNPSENQINELFTAEVLYKDVVIGELEWSEAEEDIMIFYKDGSSESASRYYEDFAERLETVFYTFTGDWVNF